MCTKNMSVFVRGDLSFKFLISFFLCFVFSQTYVHAQVTLINPNTEGGFENGATYTANGWTVVNGASTTRIWQIGTGQSGFSGTQAAFIGNNSTTVGTTTAGRVVHFYRSVTIPSGADNITLTFKYKQPIADNTFDYLRVLLNGNIPVSGTQQTAGQLIQVDPVLDANFANFTTVTTTIPNSFAGTTNNLIFSFRADGFAPHAYGAVDDISLTYTLPTCVAANTPVLTPTSVNSASFSWNCASCIGSFIVEYGPAGYTPGTAASEGLTGTLVSNNATSPATITFPTSNTIYDVYVRQLCGGSDYSSNTAVRKFIPGDVCSNAIDLASLTSPLSSTTTGATADISLPCNTNSSPDLIYFIDVVNGATLTIGQTVNGYDSENYVYFGGTCPGTTEIACFDDPDVQNIIWQNTTGSTQRVYWVQDGFSTATDAGTFTLAWSITAPPACAVPNVSLTPTGATTTDVTWTCASCTGTFIIEYGAAGFTPGTTASNGVGGTIASSSATSPFALTFPNSTTVYDVYVRQDCGANGFSNNSTVRKFIPGDVCSNAIDLSSLTSPLSSTTTGATADISLQCNTNSSPDLIYFIDVVNGATLTIGQTVNGYDSENYVFFGGTCPGTTQIACFDDPDVQNIVWQNTTGSTQRVYWVQDGFSGVTDAGTFTLAWSVTPPPTCLPPSTLAATIVNPTSVSLSWSSTATTFDVQYGLNGFALGSGTIVNGVTTNPFLLTGLTQATRYQFYVRADCGGGDLSNWTGPFSFTTPVDNNNPTCATATAFPIADNSCGTSNALQVPVFVSGLSSPLGTNVTLSQVDLVIQHAFNADVEVTLTSPAGQTFNLVLDRFGLGANFGNPATCPNALFSLQDGGTALTTSDISDVTGLYNPEQPLTSFNTGNPNGTWILNICDDFADDIGNLRYVKLSFNDICNSFVADAGSNQSVCPGGSATLTASTGTSYLWSTGEITQSITVSPTANTIYTVTVTNANGCSDADDVTVSIFNLPIANAGQNVAICSGAAVTLTASGGVTYVWSTTESTQSITVSPLVNTLYTVTVTDANGCTASDNVTVDIVPSLPADAGANVAICTGGNTTLTATGGAQYLWSTGEQTASITVSPLVTTTYSVTVSDGSSCTADDNVTVTVNDLPIANAGIDVNACAGSNTTLSATGGTQYAWSSGGSTQSITVSPLVNTNYTVTVTDANGCSASDIVTVNALPVPIPNLGAAVTVCNGASATLIANGGGSYIWSTTETTQSITVTPTANTTYTVTVTASNACTASESIDVLVGATPSVSLSAVNSSVCFGTNVVLNAASSGGTVGAGVPSTGNNNNSLAIPDDDEDGIGSNISLTGSGSINASSLIQVGLSAVHTWDADLEVYLVGPSNCGVLELFSGVGGSGDNFVNTVLNTNALNVIGTTGNNTAPFTGTFRPEGTIPAVPNTGTNLGLPTTSLVGCPVNGNWSLRLYDRATGDIGTLLNWSLSVTLVSPYTYSYSGTGTQGTVVNTGNVAQNSSVTYTNVPLGNNNYSVTVTDANGCSVSNTTLVKVFAAPVFVSANPTCSVNNDGSISVNATLDNANFTGGDVGVIEYSFNNGSTYSSSNVANNLAVGTYQIFLRNSVNPSCVVGPFSVNVGSAPAVNATNTSPVCEGSDVTISGVASGGTVSQSFSGSVTPTPALTIPDGSNTGISSAISLSGVGTVNASSIVSVTLNIAHNWAEDIDAFLVGPGNCGTLVLTTDNGTDGDNYTNTVFSTNATNPINSGTPPFTGTFLPEGTLTGTPDLSGAFSGNYTLPSTAINGCPINGNWTLRVFDDEAIVTGTLVNWSLNITLPGNYTQTVSGPGVISPVSYSGNNNSTATAQVTDVPVGSNEYVVTVTDITGCSTSNSTFAKVFDVPANVVLTTTCDNGNGGSISVSADTINNANFTGSDIGVWEYSYDGGNTWTANSTQNGLQPNTYEIYVRNSASTFCQAGPFTATVNLAPVVTVNDAGLCAGATVDLTATANGNVTYLWNTGATTATITVNATGDYYVTVTAANGCTDADTATVTPSSNLTVSLQDYEFCDGNNVTLDAGNAGATYLWSPNGETTQSITAAATNTYSVTVTQAGCSGTASSNVVVRPNPTANLADDSICDGDVLTLDAGNAGDTYVWSTGVNTQTIEVSTAGTYEVTVTNQFNCTVTSSATVTVNALPTVALQDETICDGEVATLDAANAGSTFAWSPNGETTQSITVSTAGVYEVTVTDANGCSASDDATLTVNTTPTANAGADQSICEGETATLIASGGGDYLWSEGSTTVAIAVLPVQTTDYFLTVTSANGCTDTDTVVVTVNLNPTATISGNNIVCSTNATTLTASGGVSYDWSTNATTATISVNPQTNTTYTVTVTAQNGCSDSASISITVNQGPDANAGSDVGVCEGGTLTLFGSGGGTYEWSNGTTSANITISPTTTTDYTLTVTDANGCADTDDVTVFVIAKPTVSITLGDVLFCVTDADVAVNVVPQGGTLSGTGVTGNNFSPATAGVGSFILTYSFTDANACSNEASVAVAVDECSGIEELMAALQAAQVYPNPFYNNIQIKFTATNEDEIAIKMFDVLGKELYSENMAVKNGENIFTIDNTDNFAVGLYYIKLIKANQSASFKVSKL